MPKKTQSKASAPVTDRRYAAFELGEAGEERSERESGSSEGRDTEASVRGQQRCLPAATR